MTPLGILQLVVAAISLVSSITLGVVVLATNKNQAAMKDSVDKLNRSEDKREKVVADLSTQLHAATEKLIDERFRAISHKVREETNAATLQMQSLGLEAKKVEDKLAHIAASLPEREMAALKDLTKFKDDLCGRMTSRDDFKDFRDSTNKKLDELGDDLKNVITLTEMRELLKGFAK